MITSRKKEKDFILNIDQQFPNIWNRKSLQQPEKPIPIGKLSMFNVAHNCEERELCAKFIKEMQSSSSLIEKWAMNKALQWRLKLIK